MLSPVERADLRSASPDFYKLLRRALLERDVKLIVDEANCCFGATGELWAHSHWMLSEAEVPDFVIFGGRAQAAGFFTKFEHRREGLASGGDMRRLEQFAAIWKEFLNEQIYEDVIDAGTLLKLELGRVAKEMPWMIQDLRGQGSLLGWDCDSAEIREALVEYLLLNGVRIGRLGERGVVLRPALTLTAQQAGLLVTKLEKFDQQVARGLGAW